MITIHTWHDLKLWYCSIDSSFQTERTSTPHAEWYISEMNWNRCTDNFHPLWADDVLLAWKPSWCRRSSKPWPNWELNTMWDTGISVFLILLATIIQYSDRLYACSVPEECPEAVRDVIMACRASDPADRPTAKEVFRRLSTVVHPNRPRAAGSILSSSLWNPQNSYHGRPPWAPPEHADGEENPSFMACIQEDGPPDNVGQQSNPRRSDQRKACQPFRQDQPQGMVQQSKLELASHRAMSL